MNRKHSVRGSAMVEFALAGVVAIILIISTIELAIAMWHYHALTYAVHEAASYVSVHGRGCITGTTSCSITVADISQRVATQAIGMASSDLSLTLTSDSGTTKSCVPMTSCLLDHTQWPPTSNLDNTPGKLFTVSAAYRFRNAILFSWPGAGSVQPGTFTASSSSTQAILF